MITFRIISNSLYYILGSEVKITSSTTDLVKELAQIKQENALLFRKITKIEEEKYKSTKRTMNRIMRRQKMAE